MTELTAPSRLLRLVLPDGRQQDLRGRLRAAADGTVQRTVAVMGTERPAGGRAGRDAGVVAAGGAA